MLSEEWRFVALVQVCIEHKIELGVVGRTGEVCKILHAIVEAVDGRAVLTLGLLRGAIWCRGIHDGHVTAKSRMMESEKCEMRFGSLSATLKTRRRFRPPCTSLPAATLNCLSLGVASWNLGTGDFEAAQNSSRRLTAVYVCLFV